MFGRRSTDDRSTSTGFGRGWYAAAALMGVVVLALVTVLVVVGTRDNTPAPGQAASVPPAPTALPTPASSATDSGQPSPQDSGRPAGCTTTGTNQTVPTNTPAGVTWTLVKGAATPVSAVDGPALHSPAGVGYCYSHTPVGAVLAMSNLGRATGNAQKSQDDQLKYSTVPGPLADQIAAKPPVTSDPAATVGVQLAGFRIISYTPDTASIALAFKSAAHPTTFGVGTAAMQWNQGDWRVVVQPGLDILVTGTTTMSLADYVPWSGVS